MEASSIIHAVMAVLVTIVTYFLIPWLRAKTGESKWNLIVTTAQHAIHAAEQIFDSGQGAQKKQYVQEYLNGKNMTLDDTVVEGLVKALYGKSDATNDNSASAGVPYSEFSEVE